MALAKSFNETDFRKFEMDLLSVLKEDKEHKIDFDGKLLFRSRRYECLLAATDVHWDEKTGDVVLVGAYRSGAPLYDETKSYPAFKKEVAVPLRECFDDLKASSGEEMRLLSKAKKAVIDKYFGVYTKSFDSKGLFDDGIMDIKSFGCGGFRLADREVVGLAKDSDGKVNLVCSNSFNPSHTLSASDIRLKDIQNFGGQLEKIRLVLNKAQNIYIGEIERLRPKSMSFDDYDQRRFSDAALVAVYRSGVAPRVMDAICRHNTGRRDFDSNRYSAKDIEAMVKRYETVGVLSPVSNNNQGRSI